MYLKFINILFKRDDINSNRTKISIKNIKRKKYCESTEDK